MRNLSTPLLVPLLAGTLLMGACSSGDSVTSTPTSEASTAAPPTSPTASPTTAPDNGVATTAPDAVTATTVPATSAPTTAVPVAPPPTVPPTSAPAVVIPMPETAVAVAEPALVEIDPDTLEITRTINEFFTGEGLFRGSLRLSPDRSTIYFSEGYEDGWYQCDSSIGMIGRVDVATGEVTMLGSGIGIELSPDGTRTVHLDSEACVPDPEAPDLWVLTPYDRVVVTDVASGSSSTYVTNDPPTDYGSPGAVDWADLADDGSLLVLMVPGEIYRIPAGATGAIQDFPVVARLDDSTLPIEVVGNEMISIVYGLEGSTDVVAISLDDGARRRLAASETSMAVGVSDEGAILVASPTPVTVYPGATVQVLELGVDDYLFDLDW